ncbi:MAG: hypothetical protein V7609_2629 [Verrucomicrobiota bacterium]
MHVVQIEGVAIFPGSARALACWLRRLAATNFRDDGSSHLVPIGSRLKKFALARRQRQHARARALPG